MSSELTHGLDQRPYGEDELAEILAAWLGSCREPVDEIAAGDPHAAA